MVNAIAIIEKQMKLDKVIISFIEAIRKIDLKLFLKKKRFAVASMIHKQFCSLGQK